MCGEPIQESVGSGYVSLCVRNAESSMGKGQNGRVTLGSQLVADDPFFYEWLVPFVFENTRWIPHQDPTCDRPLLTRPRWDLCNHFDSTANSAIDHCRAKPINALFGIGNRCPDLLDRMG